jgi:C-terminal processing protease CtpA/Prc
MRLKSLSLLLCCHLLLSCGGGGSTTVDNGGSTNVPPTTPSEQCSIVGENQQLLDYLQATYYWYQDIPAGLDPATFTSPHALLEAAKVPQDRFSFIMTQAQYAARFTDANFIGYGFSHRLAADLSAIELRYTYDNGAAKEAGMTRGDKLIAIDDIDVSQLIAQVNEGTNSWDNIFGAAIEGVNATFKWQKPSGDIVTANLAKTLVDRNTVLHSEVMSSFDKKIGYIVFDSFVERGADDLNTVFNQFKAAEVGDVVLDLRYNGGGLVSIANQLSSQIAGRHVLGQTFVNIQYNDKQSAKNTLLAYNLGQGVEKLDLDRVIILTTAATCSASELVINALSPFINVVTVGETTCGKPVGMDPQPICDNMVFAINFSLANVLGNSDYFDGLAANCFAEDKIVADWGNINDPLLLEGLFYANNSQCFSVNKSKVKQSVSQLTNYQQWLMGSHDR